MGRRLVRVLALSFLLGGAALADEARCDCGKPSEQCDKQACTCSPGDGGQCPLHRPGMGKQRGGGPMMGTMPMFDAKTVGTFRGTVTGIERVEHHAGMVGVHLRLQSGTETLVVHLGPAPFVDPKMTFAVKDELTVKGSKLTLNGEATVLATTVTRSGKSIDLRKDDGTPLFRLGAK